MKQKALFFLLAVSCSFCKKAQSQFYKVFENLSSLATESAAIELDNGFVFGFTETDPDKNFHENILLVKTSVSGNIIWSKRFDAGTGTSLHLMEMMRTAGNEILISGARGPDNKFYKSPACIIKLNAAGKILWAKKYLSNNVYDSRGLAQLKDSSFVFSLMTSKKFPAVVQIGDTGDIRSAVKVNNRQFQSVHGITAAGNKANIIVGDNNVVNINFKNGVQSHQKQYNTSGQFVALLSTVCQNGDIVYLAGRNAGGLLKGNARIYRTTANGNLLWAKNIDAFVDSSNSIFSRFDIVSQVMVHEDIKGNIVAVVQAESTQNLVIVLNANGKYLHNRLLYAPHSFIKEITDGSYLHCAPAFNNPSGNTILSNRFLSNTHSCDSSIFVKVTNGTDSAETLDTLIFSNANITAMKVPVTVKDTTIQPNIFCSLLIKNAGSIKNTKMPVTIIPNPAAASVMIKTIDVFPFTIYSMHGVLKIRATTNQLTDISGLEPGIYIIEVITKDEVTRKTLVKQ